MKKFLYPEHLVHSIITERSECGKFLFLTNLIINFNIDFEKVYIYPQSLHQGIYQKVIICFSSYIPIYIVPNISYE